MSHTKEPWMAWRDGSDRNLVGPSTNYTVAQCFHTPEVDSCEANARRIVACVNACAGMPTDVLEDKSILKASAEIMQQRDELLSALESLLYEVERGMLPNSGPAQDIAREAIAKAAGYPNPSNSPCMTTGK
jgi:hypothetical protein